MQIATSWESIKHCQARGGRQREKHTHSLPYLYISI